MRCILLRMTRRICLISVALALLAGASLLHSSAARAGGWCWPDCSNNAILGPGTPNYNGCWYSSGEACSGWNYWTVNGISKVCYPFCAGTYTEALVLYGFENRSTIRGRFTDYASVFHVLTADVGMGGYLRAQVNWWPYSDGRWSYASKLNAAAG
jgi:hypothetical protein